MKRVEKLISELDRQTSLFDSYFQDLQDAIVIVDTFAMQYYSKCMHECAVKISELTMKIKLDEV